MLSNTSRRKCRDGANKWSCFSSLSSLADGIVVTKKVTNRLPSGQRGRLHHYIKSCLQDHSLFSGSGHVQFHVRYGPILQDGVFTLGYSPPRTFEITEMIDCLGDEFQVSHPLSVILQYTPPRPGDKIVTGDDHFHCWTLYLSCSNDTRLSRTSALRIRTSRNLIARARIHPLALGVDEPALGADGLSCLFSIFPARSSFLLELLGMSINHNGRSITIMPPCPQTWEPPRDLVDSAKLLGLDLLLACSDNGAGYWQPLYLMALDPARQIVRIEDLCCPITGDEAVKVLDTKLVEF